MKKFFMLMTIFALILAACDNGNSTGTVDGNKKTTLTISNQSDINIFNVEYSSIAFGNINSGKSSTKDVDSGTKYVFFSLQVNGENINCRTDVVTCEKDEDNNYNITNNTTVTATASDRKDGLKNLYNTITSFPSNFRLLAVTENSVSLTWNAVNEASGYNIYRSTSNNGTYNKMNVNAITDTEFTDASVSSNVVYYYTISAITNGVESAKSDAISVTTLLPMPNNLQINEFTDISVTIAWNAVNGAGSYNVYRSATENGIYTKVNTIAISSTSFTDTGILPITIYYYKVCAVSNGVEGIQSNSISVTTLKAAPTNVQASIVTDSSIKLTWNAINGASGYNVYRSVNSNSVFDKINTSSIVNNEFSDANVSQNTAYYYKVSATVDNVETAQSASISVITRLIAPNNVQVSSTTLISINLTWNSVSGANKYNIYRSTSENGTYNKINSTEITLCSYSDKGLPSNTVYYYKICAVAGSIEGMLSDIVLASTLTPAPDNLRVSAITDSSISLAWSALNGVVGYNVYRSISENGTYNKVNSGIISSAEYTDTGVSSNSTYYYKVSAVTSNTESLQSTQIYAGTGSIVPGTGLTAKLNWLDTNAASNTRYVIEMTSDESINRTLSYSGKTGITITLVGIGSTFTINALTGHQGVFTINTGVTLVLNNVTLRGNNAAVVYINGGTMIINSGTKITGGKADNSNMSSGFMGMGGGGVFLGSGLFIMNGGEISDNEATEHYSYSDYENGGGIYILSGTFNLNNGKIHGNRSYGSGGGVHNSSNGTFNMKGGEISGNNAAQGGGVYSYGNFRMGGGVIYGSNAIPSLKNTAWDRGAAVGSGGQTMEYGSFNGDTFYSSDTLNAYSINDTMRIVDGNLLTE